MITRQHWAPSAIAGALVTLAVVAPVGPSGDSIEYVALARQLAHHASVTFSADEAVAAGIHEPAFVGRDGRQDVWHFWFYPALVAPVVLIADQIGLDAHRAFALGNALLLCGLVALLTPRVGIYWAVIFVAGPIIWWLPRAQVEVFTFSGIAAGCALVGSQPALAALLFGIASTQNPAIAVATVFAIARAVSSGARQRSTYVWIGLALAASALHPAYYLWHLGRMTPLVAAGEWRLPSVRAFVSPLVDLNFGFVWFAPLSAAILMWALTTRASVALRLFLVGCMGLFLLSFTQAPNVNHGGTPSLSRYALWLIPLPLLVVKPPSGSRWMALLAGAVVIWTGAFFWPTFPESHLRPSPLAEWVWQTHPAWDNPLPEVFAERLRHTEPAHTIAATENCAKVLTTDGVWPSSCSGVLVSERCASAGAICYANRRRDGAYDFIRVRRR